MKAEPSSVLFAFAGLLGVMALMWAERHWSLFGLWIFVGLTLTLGFAHGALDVWLMRDAKGGLNWLWMFFYALSVVAVAALVMPFTGVALILLIALSIWHFGEEAASHALALEKRLAMRFVQGGASVMLPVLLSPQALKPWIEAMTSTSLTWVWGAWLGMAWIWVAALVALICFGRPWREKPTQALWLEIAALLLLNLFLSPLLAFALFFGLYHSLWHIWRMRRLLLLAPQRLAWTWLAVVLCITWAALAMLWWQWPQAVLVRSLDVSVLNVLVVALAAVTVPHLLLVYRARQQLFLS
jgi:beta-carotene 15,15'-dioxygenase